VGEEELALEQTMRQSETDRLGTATANASGVGAAAGPGGDGAGGRSISTSGYDVTLVSQTSDDRAWMVVHLAKRWGGPISIAIFCVEPEERYMQAERRRLAGIARQPGSSVAEVHGKASAGYPVNFLRNTAIARVQTSHFLLTDIDLWPSTDSYNEVLRQGAAFLRQRKLAMVLPAFEYNAGHTDYASSTSRAALARDLPDTFAALRDCMSGAQDPKRTSLPRCSIFKAHTDTHLSTDYPRWWRATWPSLIPCFKSLRYEPYVVVPRLDTTPGERDAITDAGSEVLVAANSCTVARPRGVRLRRALRRLREEQDRVDTTPPLPRLRLLRAAARLCHPLPPPALRLAPKLAAIPRQEGRALSQLHPRAPAQRIHPHTHVRGCQLQRHGPRVGRAAPGR